MKDGDSYHVKIVAVKDGQDIVFTGQTERTVLIPASRLFAPGAAAPLSVDDYEWSVDGKLLLIFTNSARVWRRNTRGDYWVLRLGDWSLRKLGVGLEPESLMFAKFSPQSDRVAYVSKNNIYVESVSGGEILPLTRDGREALINGTFDLVYEEEFNLRDGFRWSPDGKLIAFWQLDSSEVREFQMINNTDGLYPRVVSFRYPKAGEANSSCRVGVVSSAGGEVKWLRVPGDTANHYIARMEWAASPREVVLQRLNRLQNANEVMIGEAARASSLTAGASGRPILTGTKSIRSSSMSTVSPQDRRSSAVGMGTATSGT
jgi:dipeptidyl-peptidase-4